MDYIPVPGVVQAEMIYNWAGSVVENVLHFEPDGDVTIAKMNELGLKLVTWYDTLMDLKHPTTISLIQIKMTDMTESFTPVVNYSTGLPKAGLNVGASLPNNCALVITKRTALRGRSFRGRLYHIGLKESEVTDNTVLPAQVTDYVNYYDDLMTFTTTSDTWHMVVVSRKQGGNWLTVGEAHPVVSMDSDGVVDSQRRRLPGRGQ